MLLLVWTFFAVFGICCGNLPPVVTTDLAPILVKENERTGVILFTVEAEDPEGGPVRYTLSGPDNLRIDTRSGEISLVKRLDRETRDTLNYIITIEDEVPNATNNKVKLPLELVVLDINDNSPKFQSNILNIDMNENAQIGSRIIHEIRATDVDQVGQVLEISMQQNHDSSYFSLVPLEASSRLVVALITLRKAIVYENDKFFNLTLTVSDGENHSFLTVIIHVRDVQNSPPKFVGSHTGIVKENATIETLVMKIQAIDQDRGNPRRIMYQLVDNPFGFFSLSAFTGELRTAKPLDREAVDDPSGVLLFRVKAIEMEGENVARGNWTETQSTFRITIEDSNDERPTFSKNEYRVEIPENLPVDSPIPGLDMVVTDSDVGSNSAFNIRLQDPSGFFSITPKNATGTTSIGLRLSKMGSKTAQIGFNSDDISPEPAKLGLDYENPNERKFILLVIAEENETIEKLSSTATIIVSVTDTNDNRPIFQQEAYTAVISETASGGAVVTSLIATDRDSGERGTKGLVYQLVGKGAEKFGVDRMSGVVTVARCATPGRGNCLDFETQDTYYLSLKATDSNGNSNGLSSDVPLRITLSDSNDNPPRFTEDVYRGVVKEGATDFEPQLYVKALDPDKTSRIKYSIVGGDLNKLFRIDQFSGRITVGSRNGLDISKIKKIPRPFNNTNSEDRQSKGLESEVRSNRNLGSKVRQNRGLDSTVTLTVQATDGVGSHTSKVRIRVEDVNNNAPVFEKNSYRAEVQETAPIGSVIETVSATDKDSGSNAQVVYTIGKGSFNHFMVNKTTGQVTVVSRLNFDKIELYTLQIDACDEGVPKLCSSAMLEINVIDNNNKKPIFTPTTQRIQVKEDTVPGTVLHVLKVYDADVSHSFALNVRFHSFVLAIDNDGLPVSDLDQFTDLFSISQVGEVTLSKPLNRNVTTEITFKLTVEDPSASPEQVGFGYLVVTILDVNDYSPTFLPPWSTSHPFITVSAPEELPLGSVITTLVAEDPDSNIEAFEFSPPSPYLDIDRSNGVVTVKKRLNYEQMAVVNATVIVKDSGLPQLTSTATILVQLRNINDEEPKFEQELYQAAISEDAVPGNSVIQVKAFDRDEGRMGQVSYSLVGDNKHLFSIDFTGLITVKNGAKFDREKVAEMMIRAVATDNAPIEDRKQSSVPVHIKILDVNDHRPIFEEKIYTASVIEGLSLHPPVPIVQVKALDKDTGINSELFYSITKGTGQNLFRMDSKKGVLYPSQILDARGKKNVYDLTVEVRDKNGTGVLPDSTRVIITVLPKNFEKPKFVLPPYRGYKITIPEENTKIGTPIIKIKATDGDLGLNGEIRYYFKVNESNVEETNNFKIDAISGTITTKVNLDREEKDSYNLVLVAKDLGSPISFESLRILNIVISDLEDHSPKFSVHNTQVDFSFKVLENTQKNTRVGQVIAKDFDLGKNARIFYYILSGNEDRAFFIDKSDGSIFTSEALDREFKNLYELLVLATNDPNFNLESVKYQQKSADLKRQSAILKLDNVAFFGIENSSVAKVSIEVEDVNDSPPKFKHETIYAGVSYDASVGHVIREIRALDGDRDENGTLVYSIRSSIFYKPGETKPVGSIVTSPFNLTGNGELKTASLLQPYRKHRFVLSVQAREIASPYRTATCLVHIWVWEKEDLIKVVLEVPPVEVESHKDQMVDRLSSFLNGRAVIDEIQYYTFPNNSVNRHWTEMFMHVVNESGSIRPHSNETAFVVPAHEVLKVVDKNYPRITESNVTAIIRNIYPAVSPAESPVLEMDTRFVGLISLVVALGIGLFSFFIACCCLKLWVLSPSKSNEMLIHRAVDDDQGLNTTENPLWIDQKLKRYEEQELSMQVISEFDPSAVHQNFSIHEMANAAANPMDTQSNTYATIQKSHGGTIRSMQLHNLQNGMPMPAHGSRSAILDLRPSNFDPRGNDDYATLDRLNKSKRGPIVPGIETPFSPVFSHSEVEDEANELVTNFANSAITQLSTPARMTNRPLPEEPRLVRPIDSPDRSNIKNGGAKNLSSSNGEPCMIAELI